MSNPENDEEEEIPNEDDQFDNEDEFYPDQLVGLQEESDEDFQPVPD